MPRAMTATATKIQENPFLFPCIFLDDLDTRRIYIEFNTTRSLKESAGEKIKELSDDYDIKNSKEISNYITINPEIGDLLEAAVNHIRIYFGKDYEKLTLRLVHDPEIMDQKYLVVDISTKLAPSEALKKLDDFDENWWLDKVEKFDNNLIFNIDFV